MKARTRINPATGAPETTVIPSIEGLKAPELRQTLAEGALCVVSNTVGRDREISDSEVNWLMEALQWISWHPGRAAGASLADGAALLCRAPRSAER